MGNTINLSELLSVLPHLGLWFVAIVTGIMVYELFIDYFGDDD